MNTRNKGSCRQNPHCMNSKHAPLHVPFRIPLSAWHGRALARHNKPDPSGTRALGPDMPYLLLVLANRLVKFELQPCKGLNPSAAAMQGTSAPQLTWHPRHHQKVRWHVPAGHVCCDSGFSSAAVMPHYLGVVRQPCYSLLQNSKVKRGAGRRRR